MEVKGKALIENLRKAFMQDQRKASLEIHCRAFDTKIFKPSS
jgi:hypothetical protein